MNYSYHIKTSNGEADGTIEAIDEEAARSELTSQYVPAAHGFIDADGKPVSHELVSIDLTRVDRS